MLVFLPKYAGPLSNHEDKRNKKETFHPNTLEETEGEKTN